MQTITESTLVVVFCERLKNRDIAFKREVECPFGRADIVTDDSIYEAKKDLNFYKTKEAVAQLLHYQKYLKRPFLYIIGQIDSKEAEKCIAYAEEFSIHIFDVSKKGELTKDEKIHTQWSITLKASKEYKEKVALTWYKKYIHVQIKEMQKERDILMSESMFFCRPEWKALSWKEKILECSVSFFPFVCLFWIWLINISLEQHIQFLFAILGPLAVAANILLLFPYHIHAASNMKNSQKGTGTRVFYTLGLCVFLFLFFIFWFFVTYSTCAGSNALFFCETTFPDLPRISQALFFLFLGSAEFFYAFIHLFVSPIQKRMLFLGEELKRHDIKQKMLLKVLREQKESLIQKYLESL